MSKIVIENHKNITITCKIVVKNYKIMMIAYKIEFFLTNMLTLLFQMISIFFFSQHSSITADCFQVTHASPRLCFQTRASQSSLTYVPHDPTPSPDPTIKFDPATPLFNDLSSQPSLPLILPLLLTLRLSQFFIFYFYIFNQYLYIVKLDSSCYYFFMC